MGTGFANLPLQGTTLSISPKNLLSLNWFLIFLTGLIRKT